MAGMRIWSEGAIPPGETLGEELEARGLGTLHMIGLRLDAATLAKVDAFLARLQAKTPAGVLLSAPMRSTCS